MTHQHGPGQQADAHEMRQRDQAAIDSMRKAGLTFVPGVNGVPSWASYGVRGADGKVRYHR